MSKFFTSPLPGFAVALAGVVLAVLANDGFAGTLACGTWGLTCGLYMLVVMFFCQGIAAVLLWRATRQALAGTPARYLAMTGGVLSSIAAVAAGGILAFLFIAVAVR